MTMQKQLSPDELTDQMIELWHQRIDGKITDSQMRQEMQTLLEANTVNTVAKNRRVINGFVRTAKATRDFNNSLKSLGN